MASSDVFTVVLERTQLDQPWGLRLQGGTDCRQPLSVYKVRFIHSDAVVMHTGRQQCRRG